jgi:hypothetical protein
MTEAEWQNCTDISSMWLIARERLSPRKSRLFGVAFCGFLRRTSQFRDAVVFEPWAEKVADGLMSLDEARAAIESEWGQDHFFRGLLADDPVDGGALPRILALNGVPNSDKEARRLLRCVAGNPFRQVALDPRCLTSTVSTLARSIYEDRTFHLLPMLTHALEEAGCTDEEILLHCRQPCEHVRGCWVVDMLTGRT